MPDRFSEDEARRIFARAAERQHATNSRPEGLSLAELQEIARASGIDPDHVASAAVEVRHTLPARESATFFGVDLEPRVSRVIPGELSDDAWADVVQRFRRTFGSKGIPSEIGRIREWTSGPTSNLHVTAEPVDGGTRVTMETSRAPEAQGTGLAIGVTSVLLSALLIAGLVQGTLGVPLAVTALIVSVFAVMFGGYRWHFARWRRERERQFDALLDYIELIARAEASGAAPSAHAEAEQRTKAVPRLDLGALDESSDAIEPDRRRDRTR